MEQKIHNLDDVQEYFDFIILGHKYRFRHMTTLEAEELKKVKDDAHKSTQAMLRYIKPVNPKSPSFKETYKKMTIPHLKKFTEMIESEFGG